MTASHAIDFDRFPWHRPLVAASLRQHSSVQSLFAGDPRDPASWTRKIAEVRDARHDRAAISRILVDQLTRRGASLAALQAAASLADSTTVAVVTGQQAGLFGGPFYTWLKAVTAIQLARRLERDHGVRAVPIFWVEAEDHDWKEIRGARVLDTDHRVHEVFAADLPGAGTLPVSRLMFDASIATTLSDLIAALPPTAFTDDLERRLGRHYRAATGVGQAFAGLMDDLFADAGMVVFEAYDRLAKPLVADLFAAELAHPGRTARLANEAARAMKALGHAPQVEPADDTVALFYVSEAGRVPIRWRHETFVIGDTTHAARAMEEEAASHPERFSPNVLLRPVVQDRLFPTVCYIAGPSELAYQAQLGGVYRAFGVSAPLLVPRVSATLIDSAASRFFERHHLTLDAVCLEEETALSRLVERALPTEVEHAVGDLQDAIAARGRVVKEAIVALDPTLAGAVETTLDRMRDTLQSLQGKIVQAAKRNDETLRRQFTRTYALVYPGGGPQERVLSGIFFENRYGPDLVKQLLDVLPLETDQHYVVTL